MRGEIRRILKNGPAVNSRIRQGRQKKAGFGLPENVPVPIPICSYCGYHKQTPYGNRTHGSYLKHYGHILRNK